MLYYGTDDGQSLGAHIVSNFQLIEKLNQNSSAKDVVDAVNTWVDYLPLQYTANWIVNIFQVIFTFVLKDISFSLETIIDIE